MPDLKVTVGGGIHLAGKFRGLGTYTIEVDAGLKDIHGQELKAPYRKTVTLPALDASLQWADRPVDPALLEPSHSGVLEPRATGPDLGGGPGQVVRAGRDPQGPGRPPRPLRRRVARAAQEPDVGQDVRLKDSRVEASILPLDAKALGAGAGKFVLLGARSNELGGSELVPRQSLSQVVQVTRLGVTAALDSDSGVILVTDIETGAPMAGVEPRAAQHVARRSVWSGKSGPDGLAELTHGTMYDQPYILARYQGEAAYIPLQQTADSSWARG